MTLEIHLRNIKKFSFVLSDPSFKGVGGALNLATKAVFGLFYYDRVHTEIKSHKHDLGTLKPFKSW